MPNERKTKIVKKSVIEKRKDEERRAEIAILEIYVSRYPTKAKEFLERQRNLIDKQMCLS